MLLRLHAPLALAVAMTLGACAAPEADAAGDQATSAQVGPAAREARTVHATPTPLADVVGVTSLYQGLVDWSFLALTETAAPSSAIHVAVVARGGGTTRLWMLPGTTWDIQRITTSSGEPRRLAMLTAPKDGAPTETLLDFTEDAGRPRENLVVTTNGLTTTLRADARPELTPLTRVTAVHPVRWQGETGSRLVVLESGKPAARLAFWMTLQERGQRATFDLGITASDIKDAGSDEGQRTLRVEAYDAEGRALTHRLVVDANLSSLGASTTP